MFPLKISHSIGKWIGYWPLVSQTQTKQVHTSQLLLRTEETSKHVIKVRYLGGGGRTLNELERLFKKELSKTNLSPCFRNEKHASENQSASLLANGALRDILPAAELMSVVHSSSYKCGNSCSHIDWKGFCQLEWLNITFSCLILQTQ